jgi:hypothetical protein
MLVYHNFKCFDRIHFDQINYEKINLDRSYFQ